MVEAKCPSCQAALYAVKPVTIPIEIDKKRDPKGHVVGYVCIQCGVLLPVGPRKET